MYLDKINKLIEKRSLSFFLPYVSCRDNYYYHLGDHIGFCFECTPLLAGGEDAERTLESIYTSLPVDSIVQINLFASKYIKFILDQYRNKRRYEFKDATDARIQFLRNGTKHSILSNQDQLVRNFRLIVSCQIPSKLPQKEIEKIMLAVSRNLNHMKLHPCPMVPAHLIEFVSELINYGYDDENMRRSYNPYEEIRDQIVKKDIVSHIKRDHIQLGDTYISSMSFSQLPERWALFRMKQMIGDQFQDNRSFAFPFMLTQTTIILDHQKRYNYFKTSRGFSDWWSFLGRLAPKIGYKNVSYERVAEELERVGGKFVKTYLNIVTWADSYERLFGQLQDIRGYYNTLKFTAEQDRFINLPIFLSSLPMGYRLSQDAYLRRSETRTTNEAATLAPVIADWGGSGNPALTFVSRMGQLMSIDLFDSDGYGAVVIGKTGSGKSFFVNDILEAYLALGAKIFIIDAGRSYQKACEKFGGQYIDFESPGWCLNPFTKIHDIEMLNEYMDVLKGVIGEMISPRDDISDLHYSLIEQAIRETYQSFGSETTPTKIRDYMRGHHDTRYHDMSLMMQSFCTGGVNESYFNGPSNVNFENDLIVLELDGLRNKKHLQSVVLYLLIVQIQQDLYKTEKKGLCLMDEIKDIINKPNVNSFVTAAYRKFRKYGSSPISIFQGLNDVYESEGGRIMIENSDWIFLLRQKEESINSLVKDEKLLLSRDDINLIKSIKKVNGQYSELFIYSEVGRGLGRLIVDRFNQLLRTTNKTEMDMIETVRKDLNCSTENAIRHIIAEEKKGMLHAN